MDRILNVSANTTPTFLHDGLGRVHFQQMFFFHTVCQNNSSGDVCVGAAPRADKLPRRPQVGGRGGGRVELSWRNASLSRSVSVFTAQVYRKLPWINTALMKEKHVRIRLHSSSV